MNDQQRLDISLRPEQAGDESVLFEIYASTRKGNRPSYSRSAGPEIAVPLYEAFLKRLAQDLGKPVQAGQFGADMDVRLINDGPVTIIIDSKIRE